MSEKVGIKTKDSNSRILTRGAFICDGLEAFIADLGDGFFVVTKEAAKALANLGVEYEPVEIVEGVPSFVREFIKNKCREKGAVSPF